MLLDTLIYVFYTLLICVFLSTVVVPLTIKYVRHRNFDHFLKQAEADKLATQMIMSTLASNHAYLFYQEEDGALVFGEHFFDRVKVRARNISINTTARLLAPEDRKRFYEAFENATENGDELYLKTRKTADSEQHYFLVYIQKNYINGKSYIYGLFYVIDHIRRQQEEMREALRREEDANLKSSFLASMGHEIRTPLNAIVGFSRMLVENYGSLSEDELSVIRETISQSNTQLLKLLDNVMNYSSSSEEKLDLPLTEKVVEAIMKELYTMHTVIVPQHLELIYEPGNPNDRVLANRSSILQIVSNLMNNAIKFTPKGSIKLGWLSKEDYITIFVEDTGIGIAPENRMKIFDKYFKQNSLMAGAGIGLSLCKRLAKAMNGTIDVYSELGKGSRFELSIPRLK